MEMNRAAIIDNDQFQMERLVSPFSHRRGTVLDIGACVGWWAKKLLQHWPLATCVCYEPLLQNVAEIPTDDRIVVRAIAVDVNACRRTMYRHTGAEWKSMENDQVWSFHEDFKGAVTGQTTVQCVAFGATLNSYTSLDIVKLDVEGHEGHLLESLTPRDILHVQCFVVEDHVNYFGTHKPNILEQSGMKFWYEVPGSKIYIRRN
jgi:FkbM family methyltransferase